MMLAALNAFWALGSILAHGQSVCTVDVSKPGAAVAEICRGQQLEEFNHQFEGGLYAQMINNPSFEEIKNPIAAWYLVTAGSSKADLYPQTSSDTEMLNSRQDHCIKLHVASVDSGSVGLAKGG
jgi:alpha-N-arabinofuranosidase